MALSVTIVVAVPAHAETFQVTTAGDSGPGSLRDALAQAEATATDDQISFAPSVTGTILLTSGELDVAVGGTSGDLTIEGPGRDVLAVDAGGLSSILDVHGPGGDTRPSIVVSGLTLTGGRSDYGAELRDWNGGALRVTGADVTLDQVAISDSRAVESGGGVSVEGGSLLVTASTITDNTAGNSGDGWSGIGGGGIFFRGGEATGAALEVRDSTISDNAAAVYGGGIYSTGPAMVSDSAVSGNTAYAIMSGLDVYVVRGEGGGISAVDLTVVDSRVTGNTAGRHGGGLDGAAVVVTGSTIAGNAAGQNGGGIRLDNDAVRAEDQLRLESSTVTDNRAHVGGGLHVGIHVPVELTLSTVAANAAGTGGGLSSTAEVALKGTIVAMNAGGDLAGGGSATLAHSLVGGDPLLGPLADHGGPTETLLPASNSLVIDAGSAFGETTDQRGSPRPVDDPGAPDTVDGADIGAVELTETEQAGLPQVGNTTRPTITGRIRVGDTLHTDGGSWQPEDVSLSYQWLRNGAPIPDATSATYTIGPEDFAPKNPYDNDLRKGLSVRVTAAADGHRDGSALSDFTRIVRKGYLAASRPARVTGKLRVGSTLRARPHLGAISPRPTDVVVAWFLDDKYIERARDRRQIVLKPRMRGQRVKVKFYYDPPWGYHRLTQVVKRPQRVR